MTRLSQKSPLSAQRLSHATCDRVAQVVPARAKLYTNRPCHKYTSQTFASRLPRVPALLSGSCGEGRKVGDKWSSTRCPQGELNSSSSSSSRHRAAYAAYALESPASIEQKSSATSTGWVSRPSTRPHCSASSTGESAM